MVVFRHHFRDENQVVEALQKMDIVCVMRERTPFPQSLPEKYAT